MTSAAPRKLPARKISLRKSRVERKDRERAEMEALQARIDAGMAFGAPPLAFADLPISTKTLQGLTESHFVTMTDIQRSALPVALIAGLDVIGTAKTGSGKTLAFLIPILERLYLKCWSPNDGLGALVIAPTRELAVQTFHVLRAIGKHHSFSAGLVIGGNNLRDEQEAIGRMNILVATPGRLLQHLDQSVGLSCDNLQILVLDEADRILDLGFAKTMDAILQALSSSAAGTASSPHAHQTHRQTLLFSATQTESVAALCRVSMKEPMSIAVHAQDEFATPDALVQKYTICTLGEKMDRLFSFIKANIKGKTIVFLSSCKQVRFVFEAFCKLQPGTPLMHLHGRQKQIKRMSIVQDFCQKKSAVLFATDIAARGLDFPSVDWVVQVDCPEDVQTYIHRVGRTARLTYSGSALLFLLPSEVAFLDEMAAKKIPIAPFASGPASEASNVLLKRTVSNQLQALCSQDPALRYLGQKALVSYVRSVFLHGNKKVFKVHELDIDNFAVGLGLPGTPKLRFVAKSAAKNASRQAASAVAPNSSSSDEDEVPPPSKAAAPATKMDRIFNRKNLDVLSPHYAKLREAAPEEGHDEDFFTVKRRNHEIAEEEEEVEGDGQVQGAPTAPAKISATAARKAIQQTKKKYALKRQLADGKVPSRTHVTFADDGKEHSVLPYTPEASFDQSGASNFISSSMEAMREADLRDAERQRRQRREARIQLKTKVKEAARAARAAKAPRLQGAEAPSDED